MAHFGELAGFINEFGMQPRNICFLGQARVGKGRQLSDADADADANSDADADADVPLKRSLAAAAAAAAVALFAANILRLTLKGPHFGADGARLSR